MAAALYTKLDATATTLQNWKIESPVNQLIDKVENYFNKANKLLAHKNGCFNVFPKAFDPCQRLTYRKLRMQIKGELDTLERTKDDELKKFKSQNIHFDFAILVRIKELMVEVSSNCMELALKVLIC